MTCSNARRRESRAAHRATGDVVLTLGAGRLAPGDWCCPRSGAHEPAWRRVAPPARQAVRRCARAPAKAPMATPPRRRCACVSSSWWVCRIRHRLRAGVRRADVTRVRSRHQRMSRGTSSAARWAQGAPPAHSDAGPRCSSGGRLRARHRVIVMTSSRIAAAAVEAGNRRRRRPLASRSARPSPGRWLGRGRWTKILDRGPDRGPTLARSRGWWGGTCRSRPLPV